MTIEKAKIDISQANEAAGGRDLMGLDFEQPYVDKIDIRELTLDSQLIRPLMPSIEHKGSPDFLNPQNLTGKHFKPKSKKVKNIKRNHQHNRAVVRNQDSRESSQYIERSSFYARTKSSVASIEIPNGSLASIPKQAALSPAKMHNGSRKFRLRKISTKELEERGDILDDLPIRDDMMVSMGSPRKISEKTGMSFKRQKQFVPSMSMPRGFH